MNYLSFVVEAKDPRPIKPFIGINNYGAQGFQEASFVHGFYTGAVVALSKKHDRDVEALEDISLKDAKIKIKLYFEEHHGESVEYLELIEQLKIPLPRIVEACGELEKEGKIAPVD